MRRFLYSVVGLAAGFFVLMIPAAFGQVTLSIRLEGSGVLLSYPSQEGFMYELERSTNLTHWERLGPARSGTGFIITEGPIETVEPGNFFRVLSSETPTGLAPTPEEMAAILVDTTWIGYTFASATRFHWFNEWGNWLYTKTGPDTGLIVFTYDEDDNDPDLYREEVKLVFLTPDSGTARYSEWIRTVENPRSIDTFAFNFDARLSADVNSAGLEIGTRLVWQSTRETRSRVIGRTGVGRSQNSNRVGD